MNRIKFEFLILNETDQMKPLCKNIKLDFNEGILAKSRWITFSLGLLTQFP